MDGVVTISAGQAVQRLTLRVRVTGIGRFRARWRVAIWLMRLAGVVAGCQIQIEERQ